MGGQNKINTYLIASVCLLESVAMPAAQAAQASTADDAHIRQIVQSMLKEKDQKIEMLEARIKQLESEKNPPPVSGKADVTASAVAEDASTTQQTGNAKSGKEQTVTEHKFESEATHKEISNKIADLGKKVDALKTAAEEKGLLISGFFDVNAKTGNATEQTFSVGSVELDLDYAYGDHFGASSALVLCGNSSNAAYAAPVHITCGNSGPGGLSGGNQSGFAVALVDYHSFDDRIPPRGRLFNSNGIHIQAGRFDLPFSTDYQNFANKDRITVTAPITTTRMQLGGFNGDGIRSYGSNGMLNYSLFWTDAVYANDGHSVGGRIGLSFGKNPYQIHRSSHDGLELGISHLADLNSSNHIRNSVYGADFSLGMGMLWLQSEAMYIRARTPGSDADGMWPYLQSYSSSIVPTAADPNPLGSRVNPLARNHQFGLHTTLIADLDSVIHKPLLVFARYGLWRPSQQVAFDYDGATLVNINNLRMLTLGFNYKVSDHFRLKFEYNDSLGSSTTERYFDRKLGIAQMVMSF